ncbi:MAG: ArsR family transcriptional regulator [Desulfobacula sp.]|jgi:predicted transcriptional regulator|nr:ArsR family transcriptional regulator [Desulfobacula sp.]
MKIRKVKIGIQSLESALNDFVETGRALEEGKPVKKEKGVYFTSVEAFRKALTPKRLELLRAIKTEKPSSIRQLSKITERDIKNISADISFLEQAGLVDIEKHMERERREITPFVNYDKILFEVSVA